MVKLYYKFRSITDVIAATLSTATYVLILQDQTSLIVPPQEADLKSLLLNMFATSASLMGFVLAAGTFLISHVQHQTFDVLRASRSYKDLAEIIEASIWRLFGLSCFSLIALVVGPSLRDIVVVLVIFFSIWSGLALMALIWIVSRILAVPVRSGI